MKKFFSKEEKIQEAFAPGIDSLSTSITAEWKEDSVILYREVIRGSGKSLGRDFFKEVPMKEFIGMLDDAEEKLLQREVAKEKENLRRQNLLTEEKELVLEAIQHQIMDAEYIGLASLRELKANNWVLTEELSMEIYE